MKIRKTKGTAIEDMRPKLDYQSLSEIDSIKILSINFYHREGLKPNIIPVSIFFYIQERLAEILIGMGKYQVSDTCIVKRPYQLIIV